MPRFVVEAYLSAAPGALEAVGAKARSAAGLVDEVRYVRTTLLRRDETCLHAFEAPSLDALERAIRLAGLEHDRIVEAIETSDTEET